MTTPIYYCIDPDGILIGRRSAQVDPLESEKGGTLVYMRPGLLDVTVAPPDTGSRQAAVWDGTRWIVTPDHRGETWWRAFGNRVVVERVGDPVLDGLVPTEPPAPYAPPTADDVRAEAARRIRAVLGARDEDHARIIQIKAHEAAIAILDKRALGLALTAAELERQARFLAGQQILAAIRAASNAMEASPPDDYANNGHWPATGG